LFAIPTEGDVEIVRKIEMEMEIETEGETEIVAE
jgi:hypothetical protein